MPLVTMIEELEKAEAGGYAVPCFDVFEAVSAGSILETAEEKESPVILAFYDSFVNRTSAVALAAFIRTLARQASIPVSLMLDHGKSREACFKGLQAGLTDIMIDGSQLPLEKNIQITSEVVQATRQAGAGCEGEVGQVGSGKDYDPYGNTRKGFSSAGDVERFVNETGVDCVAIAIGTAHGNYKVEPKIDFSLLSDIRSRVNLPLVLHGGSGLSEQQFCNAIKGGISKINIFTDLANSCAQRIRTIARENAGYLALIEEIRKSFSERCGYYMDLFGSTGKA